MWGFGVGAGAGSLLMLLSTTLVPPHLSVGLSMKMKVISTDAGASLPAKDGQAEMLNSSLEKYPEVTLCARFLTHHFSTPPNGYPFQTLISYGKDQSLGSYIARSCEQLYEGCTEKYRERVDAQQWIRGKVFGNSYIFGYNYYYPVWWPLVWNTACITIRASQQYSRVNININGITVVQTEDIADNVLNSSKARIGSGSLSL